MRPGPKPDPNSLRGRVRAFYSANPDEWLTFEDMAAKFDCTVEEARRCVYKLRDIDGDTIELVSVVRMRPSP